MSVMTETTHSECDLVLSDFIGRKADWSNHGNELYVALVEKGFSVESAVHDEQTVISLTAFGFTISATHCEPSKALADAALKALRLHERTQAGIIGFPKTNTTFSMVLHWLLRGLDIRRRSWPKGKYISLVLGVAGSRKSISCFHPEELFTISEGVKVPMMPRLVMMDGELQSRYDWCATGVDIMANDWEAF